MAATFLNMYHVSDLLLKQKTYAWGRTDISRDGIPIIRIFCVKENDII